MKGFICAVFGTGIIILSLAFVAMYNGDTFYMPARGGKGSWESPWHGVVMGCGIIAFGIYGIWKSKQPAPEPPLPQDIEVKAESRLTLWLSNGFAVPPTLIILAYGVQDLNRPVSAREWNVVMILIGSILVYGSCFLLGFGVCKAIERSAGLHLIARWFILLCASAPTLGVVGIGISDLITESNERAGSFLMVFGFGPVVFLTLFIPLLLVSRAVQRLLR